MIKHTLLKGSARLLHLEDSTFVVRSALTRPLTAPREVDLIPLLLTDERTSAER